MGLKKFSNIALHLVQDGYRKFPRSFTTHFCLKFFSLFYGYILNTAHHRPQKLSHSYFAFSNSFFIQFLSILMAMQSPSSSSSFSYRFTYQVFLSFRGSDTRNGFTGHLYKALTEKGINTYIDDNDLQRGDEITPSLVKAIEESRIFIPVISINYASSKFCLDELVHIIHCYKTKGCLVLPVFFGVEPTNVRHQTGSYGEALAEHERRFQNDKNNMERLQRWKVALSQASNLSGYHFSLGYSSLLNFCFLFCIDFFNSSIIPS